MEHFSWILAVALGLNAANADLSSDKLISSPGAMGEVSFRFQNEKLYFFGGRMAYFNNTVAVSGTFQDAVPNTTYTYSEVYASVFAGLSIPLAEQHYVSGSVGFGYNFGDQLLVPMRLRYVKEFRTDDKRIYNLSLTLGGDYWVQDGLDDYRDQSDQIGDVTLSLMVGIEFPINGRARF